MNERERLIKILKDNQGDSTYYITNAAALEIVDVLLENGAIVPPVKVGDIVWIIYDNYVTTGKILAFYIDGVGYMVDLSVYTKEETVIGNKSIISKDYTVDDIFLTKEEAEQVLKGNNENE